MTDNAHQSRIATLEKRMNDGWNLIEKRKSMGQDISKLEDFWIQLLHEYEAACDEAGDTKGRAA